MGAGKPCAAQRSGMVLPNLTSPFKPEIDLSFAVGATMVWGSVPGKKTKKK